jgi:hypothetical protein
MAKLCNAKQLYFARQSLSRKILYGLGTEDRYRSHNARVVLLGELGAFAESWICASFMNLEVPESWTERLPFLESLSNEWRPLPRWAAYAWLAFYGLFLFQLAHGSGILPMIDLVFVPIHEGGHLLFGYFGHTLMIAGGTLLQLLFPVALAGYFFFKRQIAGTVFCVFCFFEQFLPIATYMADARAQELPLLTVGDPEFVEHDWFAMFSGLGLLQHDTEIASLVRVVGWIGMISITAWLLWRGVVRATPAAKVAL